MNKKFLSFIFLLFFTNICYGKSINYDVIDSIVDYHNKTTWKAKKCNDFMGLDKYMKECFYSYTQSGDNSITKTIYNLKSFEDVYTKTYVKMCEGATYIFPKALPKETKLVNDSLSFIYYKDMLILHECDSFHIYKKNKDGFVLEYWNWGSEILFN